MATKNARYATSDPGQFGSMENGGRPAGPGTAPAKKKAPPVSNTTQPSKKTPSTPVKSNPEQPTKKPVQSNVTVRNTPSKGKKQYLYPRYSSPYSETPVNPSKQPKGTVFGATIQ